MTIAALDKPKVTVYVSCHNYANYVTAAIESVLHQTFESWELIVIDDASTDKSWEVIQKYNSDPRIRCVRTEGIGLPKVANLALSMAKGEYLVRLDGDDVFDENILLILNAYLDRNPRAALVFPDFFLMNEEGSVFSYERIEKVFTKNHTVDVPPNGACTMFRVELLKGVGGYREDLGAQDGFDVWTKLFKDYKFGNVNLPLFYYRRHGKNLTNNQSRILFSRYHIKKDFTTKDLETIRPITALIPCRQYYDFVPNLWAQKIRNKSLLSIQLENCIRSDVFDQIVVCSDTEQVREVVNQYNDPRIKVVIRPTQLTYQSVSVAQTVEFVADHFGHSDNGVTTLCFIESPFKSLRSIEESLFTMILAKSDSAFAVEEITFPVYQKTSFGLQALNKGGMMSSDFNKLYRETLTVSSVRNRNVRGGSLTGAQIANFIVPAEETFFLRCKRDLEIAQHFEFPPQL